MSNFPGIHRRGIDVALRLTGWLSRYVSLIEVALEHHIGTIAAGFETNLDSISIIIKITSHDALSSINRGEGSYSL